MIERLIFLLALAIIVACIGGIIVSIFPQITDNWLLIVLFVIVVIILAKLKG